MGSQFYQQYGYSGSLFLLFQPMSITVTITLSIMKPQPRRTAPFTPISALLLDSLPDQSQLHPSHQDTIAQLLRLQEDKIYLLFTDDLSGYLGLAWRSIVQSNPEIEEVVVGSMEQRHGVVIGELDSGRISIEPRPPLFEEPGRTDRLSLLRKESENLKMRIDQINQHLRDNTEAAEVKNLKQVYSKLYDSEKIKQSEEMIRKLKQAQQQRHRKLQEQRKREEEHLKNKQQQIRKEQEEMAAVRKQQLLKKQQILNQRRQQQKQLRQQRNTQYMRIKRQSEEKPPLFMKIYEGFSRRYFEDENEKRSRMQSERKSLVEHINSEIIFKHQKEYEKLKMQKEQERKQRLLSSELQQKSRIKYHSSFQIKKEPDFNESHKQTAKQKLQKMRQYKEIVKQKYRPKVDETKRKQLLNLIEQMQLNQKHVKRVKLDNGSVIYEELKPVDHKMIGIGYLEHARELAARAKERKKQQPAGEPNHNSSKEIKKPINYLQQIRKNRPKVDKVSILDRKNLSYDEKVSRVMQQSEKLAEVTKQNEMMLRYGKFRTSEQILACKQQIDQNYLDIVNMKLKLILSQQQVPNAEGEASA